MKSNDGNKHADAQHGHKPDPMHRKDDGGTSGQKSKEERSTRADVGLADEQEGPGTKQGSEHHDPKATHGPGTRERRSTM
jgi:hypothetical protein